MAAISDPVALAFVRQRKLRESPRRIILPKGHQPRIIADYNSGLSPKDIASRYSLPLEGVQRFLETRKGYPGKTIGFEAR